MTTDDLLDHFKLEAEVFPRYTIHSTYRPNRERGIREKLETKWERTKKLGEGAFGQVWQELHCGPSESKSVRAVKILDKRSLARSQVDYKKEILALAKFSKEEYRQTEVLVSFLGWYENDKTVFLAMEYFSYGDLAMHVTQISTEDETKQIALDLLEGLRIMHAEGFAHRDLKPQNVFVTEKPPRSKRWWVKIGDFGISKRVQNGDTACRTQIGTPSFQAPEVNGFVNNNNDDESYNTAVDLWSLGCVVYRISAHQMPFSNSYELNNFCQARLQFPREPLTPRLSETGISFVERLLVPEPTKRMDAGSGLKDPWILETSVSEHTQLVQTALGQSSNMIVEIDRGQFRSKDFLKYTASPVSNTSRQISLASSPEIDRAKTLTPSTPAFFQPSAVDPPDACSSSAMSRELHEVIIQVDGSSNKDISNQVCWPNQDLPSLRPFSFNPNAHTAISVPSSTTPLKDAIGDGINWTKVKATPRPLSKSAKWTVAFSPVGRRLASGSDDETIRIWDLATMRCHHIFYGHTDSVLSVAFSPNGELLASGSKDCTVRLWDMKRKRIRHTFVGHSKKVRSVTFFLDGKLLVSGSDDRTIQVRDVLTGQLLHLISDHSSSILSITCSPHGESFAASSVDGAIRFWDGAKLQTCYTSSPYTDPAWAIAFSPDGKLLAMGKYKTSVQLWDREERKLRYTLLGHQSSIWAVAFSPDGKLLASGSQDRTIRLWDVNTGQLCDVLLNQSSPVLSIAFSPDGNSFACGTLGGRVFIWGSMTSQTEEKVNTSKGVVRNFFERFSP